MRVFLEKRKIQAEFWIEVGIALIVSADSGSLRMQISGTVAEGESGCYPAFDFTPLGIATDKGVSSPFDLKNYPFLIGPLPAQMTRCKSCRFFLLSKN